jgi:hypothetical protein
VAAEREIGLEPLLERGRAKLVEAHALRSYERHVREVRERRPAPERERLAERPGSSCRCLRSGTFDELLEAVEIELVLLDVEDVADSPRVDPLPAQKPPQRVHRDLQRVLRGLGRPVAPEPVDQALAGDDRVAVQEQEREQRTLPAAPELDLGAVPDDLEWPEQPEVRTRALEPRHRRKRAVSGR